jgi:glucose/arabinose dehydrogenase
MFNPSITSRNALFSLTALGLLAAATAAVGQTRRKAACPSEEAYYDPGHAEDIVVPEGYKVEVFARDLNFPTGLAFLGDKDDFKVLVVESGTGLPSDCNDNTLPPFGGKYSPNNPFTPDLIVLD